MRFRIIDRRLLRSRVVDWLFWFTFGRQVRSGLVRLVNWLAFIWIGIRRLFNRRHGWNNARRCHRQIRLAWDRKHHERLAFGLAATHLVRRHAHHLAILGHRAACYLKTLSAEQPRDMRVREWLLWIFFVDHVLDRAADRGC